MADYCLTCLAEDHDECSLTPGCPCCDYSIEHSAAL